MVVAVSACQEAQNVFVTNRCRSAIEVDVNNFEEPWGRYLRIDVGEQRNVLQVEEGFERTLFARVRAPESDLAAEPVELPSSAWTTDSDGDVLLDIVGALCPA